MVFSQTTPGAPSRLGNVQMRLMSQLNRDSIRLCIFSSQFEIGKRYYDEFLFGVWSLKHRWSWLNNSANDPRVNSRAWTWIRRNETD